MKKILLSLVAFFLLIGIFTSYVRAATIFDDFNDGNADGWWLGYSLAQPSFYGNWRVENGSLVQDLGYDGTLALLNGFQFSNQTAEAKLKVNGPSGGDGIVFWFNDNNNLVYAFVADGRIEAGENNNGAWDNVSFPAAFGINENRWVNLKLIVNSISGDIGVYMDGAYKFTYHATTLNRTGQTGLISGNAGGAFDDFKLNTSDFPNNLEECKNGGWKTFNNQSFRNQGQCVSFVERQ